MPRHRPKTSHPGNRRVRRSVEPPPVPVVVPDPAASGDAKPATDAAKAAAPPEPIDERIRRMIEAAYT
jgi:hypothetical protein